MIAKVTKTGETVSVKYIDTLGQYKVKDGRLFLPQELTFFVAPIEKGIDWEQRKFELVKAILPVKMLDSRVSTMSNDEFISFCLNLADAVIAKLKEE